MVGMVFQNPDDQLIGSVVEEDVAFGAENISVPHKELVKRVEDALAQVGLAASMRIEELSGGGKQKVAIAGVLAMKPRYIVLDEATSMLDPKSRRDVLQLMKELQKQGITIILITHLMEELLNGQPTWAKIPEQSTGRASVLSPRTNVLICVLMDSHGRPVCADGHTRTHTDVLCVLTDTHGRHVCDDRQPQTATNVLWTGA